MKKTRSFLKWAGNKYRCLEAIFQVLPSGNRLIEPFTGSAVVFLNANYSQYLIAESNPDLIAVYEHLKKDNQSFIEECEALFIAQNNQAKNYYELRYEFNHCDNLRRKAALFLYLNRHGYNGLCRYNKQMQYNVPFGSHKKPYFPKNELFRFAHKSQETDILHADFKQTFSYAKPGDVIYCDPPYVPIEQTTNFSAYTGNKFEQDQQILLSNLAMDCANRGITVVISNHDNEFTRYHYRQATIYSLMVKRMISCSIKRRTAVKELLAVFHPNN